MIDLPRNVIHYGSEKPLPERIPLRAGLLSLVFEDGDLRYVRLGDREVLRRLYVAIRDQNWRTVPGRLSNLRVEQADASFTVSFDYENRQDQIEFDWRGTITGHERGTITYAMDGVARSSFLRGRIGICVLHPIAECAGQPFRVVHPDGSAESGVFPNEISPHQPVHDIRSIAHPVAPGLEAEVRFEGDVFEMEDHRNWTDASFKTYSTPLHLPAPVQVNPGDRVRQSVTLALHGTAPTPRPTPPELTLTVGDTPVGALPPIGLGMASHGQPLTSSEVERLRALNLAHLRVDLHLRERTFADVLRRAVEDAAAVGVPLEVAVYLSDDGEFTLDGLSDANVCRWLVFHETEPSTAERWITTARPWLNQLAPSAPIGAGSQAYFTQLNRGRPPVHALDFVCYPITPQVHAFDNTSMVETLQAQAWTVESARTFVGDLPIVVGPITLKPRSNASQHAAEPLVLPGDRPRSGDRRQMSLFGAGWTVGSLKYLAGSGAASLTYYETTGPRGVMETEAGSTHPELFRSIPGAVFPMFHVFADLGELAGGEVLPSVSSHPLRLDGLAVRRDGRVRVILANLGPDQETVSVQGLAPRMSVRRLDETHAVEAMREPEAYRSRVGEERETADGRLQLELPPYAVVRIDGENN